MEGKEKSAIYSLIVVLIALLSISCGSTNQPISAEAKSTALPRPAAYDRTPAQNLKAARELLATGRADEEINWVRGALAGVPASDPLYHDAQEMIHRLDARIEEIRRTKNPPPRQSKENPEEAWRNYLQNEYREMVAKANPQLNFIGVKIIKLKRGYGLFAVHEFFNKYTFAAGENAHVVKKWVDENRGLLKKGDIYRVGLMSKDEWEGGCWYDI